MAYYPEKLARVFNAIAEAGGPVLIHCAGGRDRTGMVCSILLGLAGVTPDAIAENYERGFRGAAAHRGHGMAYDASTGAWVHEQPNREWSAEDLDEAVAHRLPVLMRWIETTDFAGYLQRRRVECIGITVLISRALPVWAIVLSACRNSSSNSEGVNLPALCWGQSRIG